MAVSLHLEPYPGRSAASVREDLLYLMRTVGASPALLRAEKRGPRLVHAGGGRLSDTAVGLPAGGGADAARAAGQRDLPLFFVYDSYHIPASDWAKLLQAGGELSLRGTEADGGVKWDGWGQAGTGRDGLAGMRAGQTTIGVLTPPCHAGLMEAPSNQGGQTLAETTAVICPASSARTSTACFLNCIPAAQASSLACGSTRTMAMRSCCPEGLTVGAACRDASRVQAAMSCAPGIAPGPTC